VYLDVVFPVPRETVASCGIGDNSGWRWESPSAGEEPDLRTKRGRDPSRPIPPARSSPPANPAYHYSVNFLNLLRFQSLWHSPEHQMLVIAAVKSQANPGKQGLS